MKSSELILNADGSIYHLALKPQQVADTIITVGDPDRVAKVSRHFDKIELKVNRREFVTHTGVMGGKRLTVISTGIGTDNIDIVFNELECLAHMQQVEQGGPKRQFQFIRLGTSGAVRPQVAIDSILCSGAALGLDGLMHFYQWKHLEDQIEKLRQSDLLWQQLPMPYAASPSEALVKFFFPLIEGRGVTLTAPGFYAPQGRSVNASTKAPGFIALLGRSDFNGNPITNIEMETAGIYALASLFGHQAISLSAILANRATGEFSQKPEKTVERLIEGALEVVGRM